MSTPESASTQNDEFRISGMVAAVAHDLADHKVEDAIWRAIDPIDRQIALRFAQHPIINELPNSEAFKLGFKFQAALNRTKESEQSFEAMLDTPVAEPELVSDTPKRSLISRWLGKRVTQAKMSSKDLAQAS